MKNYFNFLYHLIIFILVFAAMSCDFFLLEEEVEHSTIYYNGVYVRENDNYNGYLRFYEDNTVITVSSTGTPEQIKSWFNLERDDNSIGTYSINGDKITFSTTSSYGTVDYSGVITSNKLIIDTYSHINGFEDNDREFIFYEW